MKQPNVNNKSSGLFIKGITAVSLSLALQGKSARVGSGEAAGPMVYHMEDKKFQTTLDSTKDITLPDDKNATPSTL